jgi:glycosyltransferase involved in cell wall biosynthesis
MMHFYLDGLVSAVIPAYNAADYLREAIESVVVL